MANITEKLIYSKNGIRAVVRSVDSQKTLMLFVEEGCAVMDKPDAFEFCHTIEDEMRRIGRSSIDG